MDYQFKEMEYEEDLFQKIINREFPTEIIFEDDSVFAFEWINPVAPTHILIGGLKNGNQATVQIFEYPADSLFTAL